MVFGVFWVFKILGLSLGCFCGKGGMIWDFFFFGDFFFLGISGFLRGKERWFLGFSFLGVFVVFGIVRVFFFFGGEEGERTFDIFCELLFNYF